MLEIQNLSFQYPPVRSGLSPVLCLDQVSFTLESAKITGLIGKNGAGKSTLFKILSGSIQTKTTSSILYKGENISHLSLSDRIALGICYLPQKGGLFEDLKVQDHFEIALYQKYRKTHGWLAPIKWISYNMKADLETQIDQAGFANLRQLKASALSGGEKKRLLLSTYLILSPSCILLDEPFASLDQVQVLKLIDLLKSLKNQGIAILICDHQTDHLYDFCDQIYQLSEGKLKNHQMIKNRQEDLI